MSNVPHYVVSSKGGSDPGEQNATQCSFNIHSFLNKEEQAERENRCAAKVRSDKTYSTKHGHRGGVHPYGKNPLQTIHKQMLMIHN